MVSVLETHNLGKRYGRHWALQDCTLHIPTGSITALVGANGAGKTTLIHLIAGLLEPTSGEVLISGIKPSPTSVSHLDQIGLVSQNRSLYRQLSVKETLILGSKLNKNWDAVYAYKLLQQLEIPLRSTVGKLSEGQQTQVALVMALAKRPRLLLLDEPFANVDPLARHEFMKVLMEATATDEMTILLSSHLLTDLDKICDYLVILSASRLQVAENIEQFITSHQWLIGPREQVPTIEETHTILKASHTGLQSHLLVRGTLPLHQDPWLVQAVSLEEIVLAYLKPQTITMREQEYTQSNRQEVVQ